MKLRFKHQRFQEEAALAVCDVFSGQEKYSFMNDEEIQYLIDEGYIKNDRQMTISDIEKKGKIGIKNQIICISDEVILNNLKIIQRQNNIEPSRALEGKYNLTIEMETGVGKTYTYIKTMFELQKKYGWSKYIIVVPSIAIREGVFKSFELTCEHFAEEYNKKIRYFIYNSQNLTQLESFASDSGINVMIINSQAFNAKGKDARRISMKLDSFRSRRPIDVIAATNPIIIIDEPQSVEGEATKEKLKDFRPLMTLRYSATHKKDSIYNLVYRLDALEAYNKKLVKKIAVKGISLTGSTGTEAYMYLQNINLYRDKSPSANLEFEIKGVNGIRKATRVINAGDSLYELSGSLNEYQNFVVANINGLKNIIEFTNGVTISVGEVTNSKNIEEQIRRIQIRETIKTHIDRERELFNEGIKVLSLFFIDEVAKYKQYDSNGKAGNGEYADIFEEEYNSLISPWQTRINEDKYYEYLFGLRAENTHAGYFSIDKKSNRITESKLSDKKEKISDDVDAYDLIMKDKERLLDLKEPVRFIFSHSALREGWDNPNIFQICTLKQSGSDIRKRQEVGRGLRLCVNSLGDRIDSNSVGEDVHKINVLTIIANENYDSFAKRLQAEIAEIVAHRPFLITTSLFLNKTLQSEDNQMTINFDNNTSTALIHSMIKNDYINNDNSLSEKYYEDLKSGSFVVSDQFAPYKSSIIKILDSIYSPNAITIVNANEDKKIKLEINENKLQMKEFKALWSKINQKSAYIVDFDTDELIQKAIQALDRELRISEVFYKIEKGEMSHINSKQELEEGISFKKLESETKKVNTEINSSVKYDLIGKIVNETSLTRYAVCQILKGIQLPVFQQFSSNPEEFIIKSSNIINEQKATVIIEHIRYDKLQEVHSMDLFTAPNLKDISVINPLATDKHLYNYLISDSQTEKKFANELDKSKEVAIYVKLPKSFYINTPVGKYSPDWAIAFNEDSVKHIYFVAETKGDLSSMQLRKIEELKKHCAQKHFAEISSNTVRYAIVDNYETLMNEVMK